MTDVASKPQARDVEGRYSFDGKLDRLCVCGHTLGQHAGGTAPHDCMVSTVAPFTPCDCHKFRLSRRKSKRED